jgi:hypothetical protein
MFSTWGQWRPGAVSAVALALPAGMLFMDPPALLPFPGDAAGQPPRGRMISFASYSSKGPTLIDKIVKPDLVSPGTDGVLAG